MRVVITTTAINTMIEELMTSFLVGHATLRISERTSPRYSPGPMRLSLCGGAATARFAEALGLSVPCFAIMRLVCRFIATGATSGQFGFWTCFAAGQEGL